MATCAASSGHAIFAIAKIDKNGTDGYILNAAAIVSADVV